MANYRYHVITPAGKEKKGNHHSVRQAPRDGGTEKRRQYRDFH